MMNITRLVQFGDQIESWLSSIRLLKEISDLEEGDYSKTEVKRMSNKHIVRVYSQK